VVLTLAIAQVERLSVPLSVREAKISPLTADAAR
jgi:hypothetical protein